MNIEDYREFCLSLGEDIEEELPFQKFKNGEGVLVLLEPVTDAEYDKLPASCALLGATDGEGMGRVRPFLTATNEILSARGIALPLLSPHS